MFWQRIDLFYFYGKAVQSIVEKILIHGKPWLLPISFLPARLDNSTTSLSGAEPQAALLRAGFPATCHTRTSL
jgi:hypothetical protein